MLNPLTSGTFFRRVGKPIRMISTALLSILLLFVFGCASQQPEPEPEPEPAPMAVWPSPPEKARIRYVENISFLRGLSEKQKLTLADKLLGQKAAPDAFTRFVKPYGVHSDSNGRLFVTDSVIKGVVVIDMKKNKTSFVGTSGMGELAKPKGLTSDANGNIYVTDTQHQAVYMYDSKGGYQSAFGGKDVLLNPTGVAFNDEQGLLYVVDAHLHQIVVFNKKNEIAFTIGERGFEPGQFNFPTNISLGQDNRLYVADTMNFRVQIFEPDGTFVRSFGQAGNVWGDFNRLRGLGADKYGNVYAADGAFNNIQIFNPEGQLLLVLGQPGNSGPGNFNMPAGVHVDKNDRMFVVDQLNQQIQVFEIIDMSPLSAED